MFIYFGACLAVVWPLVQRIFTEEPSITDVSAEWRARGAAQRVWIAAPLVLVTAIRIPLGPLQLDLPDLVLPLAIWLGWRFGLRGWRTVLLMVLPSFWITAPFWVSPPTFDIAATALIAAALFARPRLFSQVCSCSTLSSGTAIVLAAALSLQLVFIFSPSIKSFDVPRTAEQVKKSEFPGGEIVVKNIQPNRSPEQALVQALEQEPPLLRNVRRFRIIEWTPSTFLVLALFLIGLSRLGIRGVAIASSVAIAGVVGLALSSVSNVDLSVRPIPFVSALAGLVAYLLGHYVRAFVAVARSAVTSGRTAWIAPSVLVLMALGAASLSFLISEGGRSTSLLGLATLMSWTAAVRLDKQGIGFRVGLFAFVVFGLFGLWVDGVKAVALAVASAIPGDGFTAFSNLTGSVVAPFLPATFFGLGRWSQDWVFQSAEGLQPAVKMATSPGSSTGTGFTATPMSSATSPSTTWKEELESDEPELFERFARKVLVARQQEVSQRTSGPVQRAPHMKIYAGLMAEFQVLPDLPQHVRFGVFSEPRVFPAVVRFSNGESFNKPDKEAQPRGIAIKLVGVPGPKLLEDQKEAVT